MVDDCHPGGVPGVGGLTGTGLAGVAPVGVQGGAAEQVAGLPGAALRPVNRARPGVRQVGRTVLASAQYERRRQGRRLSVAVEPDREAVTVDNGDGGRGAVDKRAARRAAAGVEEHPVAGSVLPLGRPPGADQDGAGESAGGSEVGAGRVDQVLGIGVRDDQCHHLLGAVAPDIGAHGGGHRAAGLGRSGQLVLPAELGPQPLGPSGVASAEPAQRLLVGRVDLAAVDREAR